jgi:hypothetical protein
VQRSHFQKLLSLAMGLLLLSPCYAANPHAFAVNEDALAGALPIDHGDEEEKSPEDPNDLLHVYRYASLHPEADVNAESYERMRALDRTVRTMESVHEQVQEQRKERHAAMVGLFKRTHPFYCTGNDFYRENQEKTGYGVRMLEITHNQILMRAYQKKHGIVYFGSSDWPTYNMKDPIFDSYIMKHPDTDPFLRTLCAGRRYLKNDNRDCTHDGCRNFNNFCSFESVTQKHSLAYLSICPIRPFYAVAPLREPEIPLEGLVLPQTY